MVALLVDLRVFGRVGRTVAVLDFASVERKVAGRAGLKAAAMADS